MTMREASSPPTKPRKPLVLLAVLLAVTGATLAGFAVIAALQPEGPPAVEAPGPDQDPAQGPDLGEGTIEETLDALEVTDLSARSYLEVLGTFMADTTRSEGYVFTLDGRNLTGVVGEQVVHRETLPEFVTTDLFVEYMQVRAVPVTVS
jgi:hypothetical protein